MDNITELFARFKGSNSIFVETGSYQGGSIDRALELGYEQVWSIEYHLTFYEALVKKYKENPKVKLFNGSSAYLLSEVLNLIGNEKCFFWLDAHDTFGTGGGVPMEDELNAIKNHLRNDHTIMIDDIPLYFGNGSELKTKLYEINPSFTIETLNPDSRPDYIMVAHYAE